MRWGVDAPLALKKEEKVDKRPPWEDLLAFTSGWGNFFFLVPAVYTHRVTSALICSASPHVLSGKNQAT